MVEALENAPHVLDKVFLARNNDDATLKKAIKNAGIMVSTLGSGKNDKKIVDDKATHQGIIGQVSLEKLMQNYKNFIEGLEINKDTVLLVLGEIQDPHNVGAIIRSAAAFGVSGVIMPQHNQSPITGTVVKVSAGMAFRVPLISVSNINATIKDLKEKGFWVYGMEGESDKNIADEAFDTPTVFILGNESKGIREKTKESCDILVSIPMHPQSESLNVAASTAVALYEWSKKHSEVIG